MRTQGTVQLLAMFANAPVVQPKLQVLLAQLPVPNNPALNVPLALGYLKAYAYAQGLLEHVEIELLPRTLSDYAGDALLVEEIVARQPDVLGFALYTWNSERSLDIIDRLKQRLPSVRVVVGGPEVQRDNRWVLEHPAVDVAVLGEGEQTFADLLRFWLSEQGLGFGDQESGGDGKTFHALHSIAATETIVLTPLTNKTSFLSTFSSLEAIPGIAFRDDGKVCFTIPRVALADLAAVPSPYLLGYLEVPANGMMMVEVSRWCPYGCSFCLYGRNMGTKLGNRYFGLERVVDEIEWARQKGVAKVHFVEANLNLVPLFWPLMRLLAELNADHQMTFYAELRGEHLTDEVVEVLDQANVRFVEVGLQTANVAALRASHRRTDLNKWAAGTRRLYAHNIEVYLDVILGLPEDHVEGVRQTLDFIAQQELGPYDVFTLQVLPGTAVREEAKQYGLRYQKRPPYYVLETSQFSYDQLRQLRRELKQGAGLDPDVIEGMPQPRHTALQPQHPSSYRALPVQRVWLPSDHDGDCIAAVSRQLANHVDVVVEADRLVQSQAVLGSWIAHNPSTMFDLYILCTANPPCPNDLLLIRDDVPYQPGYLDRVAIYNHEVWAVEHWRVSPRMFLVLPWTSTVDPERYKGIADVIWQFKLQPGDAIPFGAWRAAGGAGIALSFSPNVGADEREAVLVQVQAWERDSGRIVWLSEDSSQYESNTVNEDLTVYSGRI